LKRKARLPFIVDHDRSRTELRIEDYQEVKLTLSNKLYIARSTPFPVPLLGHLGETDHYWDLLAADGDAKLSEVSKKKVQNQAANCFDVKGEQRHRLCFDPARKVLLENLDQQRATEFSDYNEVDQHLYPGKITVLLELQHQEKPILVIGDIKIQKAQFAATTFSIPPRSAEFDTCENMQPAKPLQTPAPEFSNSAMRRNAGAPVNVYGIISKEGELQNVKVLSPDPEIQQTITEAMKKWRYSPAMCGASPVATEKEIQVPVGGQRGGR